MFIDGKCPEIWKTEYITPVPKLSKISKMSEFRPISGPLNFARIADKLMASYITQDMTKDPKQYGNEKGLSINHYLVKMIDKILKSVDKNSIREKNAVILSMLDWSKAFENQDHTLGIKSLIENKVRLSLIPTLIDLFKGRKITVKWSNLYSEPIKVTGGGPQGGNSGILEYISLTRGNLDFLANEEAFKFVDDASFLQILNLLSVGLSSINAKMKVPSDLPPNIAFLPPQILIPKII